MALDATIGASTSNSYVTRQYADDHFQLGVHPLAETWHTLHGEQRDGLLILATTQIDYQRLQGTKNDTSTTSGVDDQALHFPTTVDVDGGAEFIPVTVKDATCEQSLHLWSASGGGDDVRAQLQAAGVTSVKIRNITEVYSGRGGRSRTAVLGPEAMSLLDKGGHLIHYGRVV